MPFKNQRSPSAPISYGGVSIDPVSGSVSAENVNAGNLTVGGEDFPAILATLKDESSGTTFWRHKLTGTMPYQTPNSASQGLVIFRRNITLIGGRLYRVHVSPIMIDYSGRNGAESGTFALLITRPRRSEPNYHAQSHYLYATDINKRHFSYIASGSIPLTIPADAGLCHGEIEFRIYPPMNLTPYRIDTRYNTPEIAVEDIGPYGLHESAETNLARFIPAEPPPEPEPVTKSYTGDFYVTHYADYNLGNGDIVTEPGIIRQSTVSMSRMGIVAFNGFNNHGHTLATLKNATITAVHVYIGAAYGGKSTRWYYTSGGIGRLYYHNASSFPIGNIPGRTYLGEITNWQNNSERSYNGGATIANAIRAGTFKGFALSGEGVKGQYTYHGTFPYRMRLRVNYTLTE